MAECAAHKKGTPHGHKTNFRGINFYRRASSESQNLAARKRVEAAGRPFAANGGLKARVALEKQW
jgi:hypothetical protein